MSDAGPRVSAPVLDHDVSIRSHEDPFVGRVDALHTIATTLAGASTGQGRLVLISGEAGIGKTRLVDESLQSRDDLLVLRSSCPDSDGVPPFWAWTEALRPIAADIEIPSEVVALLPGLAGPGPPQDPSTDGSIRFRAFTLVADLLDGIGTTRPVAVVIDDLHWADRSSLQLLHAVAHQITRRHFTLIGMFRDTDVRPGHPLHDMLAELAHAGPRVQLTGLDPAEVATLLRASAGPIGSESAQAVSVRTGGNPFFVHEVGRSTTGIEQVPPAVHDVLRGRIDRLDPSVRAVLDACAVLGSADTDLVTVVGEVGPADVLDAFDVLVQARLFVPGRHDRPTFAHDLVRETTMATLSRRRTAELHHRAANAIEARSGPTAVDAIAHHRVQAAGRDPTGAVRWAAEAGRAARRQLAYEHAASWFERAAAIAPPSTPERAGLLIELADASSCAPAGLERARAAATEAADIARRSGDTELLGGAAVAFGGPFLGILTAGFAEPEPVVVADEALAALPAAPSTLRVRLLSRIATDLGYTSEHRRALEAAGEALETARHLGDEVAVLDALTAMTSIWNPNEEAGADQLLRELESISRRRRSREGLVSVEVNRLLIALEHGDRGDLEQHAAQLGRLLRELHLPVFGTYVRLFTAMLLRLDGRYDEAETELLAAMDDLGDRAETFMSAGAQLMVVLDELDRLGEIVDDARRLFDAERFRGVPSSRVVLAYFEAVAGDRAVAVDSLPRLAASWPETQHDPNWLMGLAWLCRTAVVLEDHDSAAFLVEVGRPHVARSVFTAAGTIHLGVLGMWLAEAAILLGRHDEAADLLDRAEARYRQLQDRGHLVECAYLRGRLAAGSGCPDAAALLGAAAAEADTLGMARVARLSRTTPPHGKDAPSATAGRRPARTVASEPPPLVGVFRHEGAVWQIRFAGLDVRVRDSKGMADIAVLISRPGVEVHVAELVGTFGAVGAPGSNQAMIDDEALAAYRARLRELAAEMDDAESAGEYAQVARARAEQEAIADHLGASLGLGGRARSAPDWVERARKAVRHRIDAALRRIEDDHPPAGRHLRRSVRTGAFCTYDPPESVAWEI